MERILDFSQPFDVGLLDQVVECVYQGTTQERDLAQRVLTQLQEHPDAWLVVDKILEYSKSSAAKFFGLQILESVIKYRWKVLPREQCDGIKNYIVNLIIKLSSDEATLQSEKLFLRKLNQVLVQIIKQEWPGNWGTFIPEIVGSSKTNESLCENNMAILKLMSEEIFDYSSGQMTQAKIKELKNSFNKEFSYIYQLCEYILDLSQKPSLILATLKTLLRFLNWIPLGYIFETSMVKTLIFKFFPVPMFRNTTLKCLTEIGSLNIGTMFDTHFAQLFCFFMQQLRVILPIETDIAKAYDNGEEADCEFVQDLALFLVGFFKAHLGVLEKPEYHQFLLEGHTYLAKISLVDEREIFKICLEYWNVLATDLFHETPFLQTAQPLMISSSSPRRQLYAPILSKVRVAMIGRMAKPEEVLIVEDENGELVREVMKDSDNIILYKSMRETLIFLTHLDQEDTQNIMLEKLAAQVDRSEWSWHNLNTLCWAIGSISGAQTEEDEKRFLVQVIKDLLGLCEMMRGKDNKAVIASNIMYIVGQYPRFLRAHWKFLKTVVNKLFEFMHETHPGVQDMACDTFLKIAQKCSRKFISPQGGESTPFIDEILSGLPTIIADLEPQQIHTFYEAIGHMIQAQTDPRVCEGLVARLMDLPNSTWAKIMAEAARSLEYLRQQETAKSIANILRANVRVASALGKNYISQLSKIFIDILNVYKAYSESISSAVATGGSMATRTSIIRAMRSVKKETLKLFETFIQKTPDLQFVSQNFLPPLFEAVLLDYKAGIPDARDPEVLSLMTVIINKVKGQLTNEVPRIFDAVFECTLMMITTNFEDFPEHRVNFFEFLRAINNHCFQAFFMMGNVVNFKLVIDSIVWAFKHTMRNIAESGLYILIELWRNLSQSGPEIAGAFYKTYYLNLLQDLFCVLTDTFHKSGFKLQALMLAEMFRSVDSGAVAVPLWDPNTTNVPNMNNQTFVREFVINLLSTSFQNLTPNQTRAFVFGAFERANDIVAFKAHLRDFLVQLKEFAGSDNEELFLEEREAAQAKLLEEQRQRAAAIPGMIPQSEQPTDFTMDT